MAVYPKGKGFMGTVGTGPERVRKTFKLESKAVEWVEDEKARREAAKALPAAPVTTAVACWTLQEAMNQVCKHTWRGKGGEKKALVNANQAVDFFGPDTPVSEITATWIVEWMDELQDGRSNSGSTCNKKLSALSMMLKRSVKFGGLASMPATERYADSDHRIRWFSDHEEEVMLKMAVHLGFPELRDFIVIGIDTGMRRMELLGLTLSDYVGGQLVLHAGSTKTGLARAIPASARVKALLAQRRADGHHKVFPGLTVSSLRTQWDSLRAIMGKEDDPGFIVHVLRHTCATRLVGAGVPLNAVMVWMGHKVIQTTMRYAHMQKGQLLAAVTLLESRTPELEMI